MHMRPHTTYLPSSFFYPTILKWLQLSTFVKVLRVKWFTEREIFKYLASFIFFLERIKQDRKGFHSLIDTDKRLTD